MGSHSFFSKWGSGLDSVNSVLQYVSPGAHEEHQQGKAYTNRLNVPAAEAPYYAGKTPTLADANAGYVQAAKAMIPNPATPAPLVTGQMTTQPIRLPLRPQQPGRGGFY